MRITARLAALAATLGLLAAADSDGAAPITYTETVVGSGSLAGPPFTDALITLTATADTDNVMSLGAGAFLVENASATFQVAGVGSGTFSFAGFTFDQQSTQVVGLQVQTTDFSLLDILDIRHPA